MMSRKLQRKKKELFKPYLASNLSLQLPERNEFQSLVTGHLV